MFDRRTLQQVYSLSYYDLVVCNCDEMEGYYVEKTWFVFESHCRNTFCERNVCEESGVSIQFDCTKTKLEPYKAIRQRESQRNERYQGAEKVGLGNESLYVETDFFISLLWMQISPQKFLSFALLKPA